ncbi:subclass B1 metallo-beta-lactamase [Portibacter lacus]|uniref:beta-lactamase n=1 Tax=Portibacter lacus TaxID=1099794 RepID=A0AA37SQW2_9BACT|nr:subclass B1 metallo-beta-lactamase [Portibacter lacus]GLR16025.1 beta-lactamase [Portibacter lacus]
MKGTAFMFFILTLSFISCKTKNIPLYKSEQITIEPLTANTYRHISYLSTDDFGKVSCNGMIVVDQGEAIVMDTPTNDEDSKELIDWIENTLKAKVVGVVVTHFHADCLGGLNEFHKRSVPSYASFRTIELAKNEEKAIPQVGFETSLAIEVGYKKVHNEFFGEGHTQDNIICYFPSEEVIFGGCLIKTLDASKGYLGDANVDEWSNTVEAIKSKYRNVKVIVPGHGDPGNTDLLDYTIALFRS